MLIVVMMGKFVCACSVVHNVRLYSVLDTVVISGKDVCCSVVFGTLVGVLFSVMQSELLMTSDISCPLWSSVYECHKVECAFTSPVITKCGMFVMSQPFEVLCGLPLHNILSPFLPVMDIFSVNLKFYHVSFYTLQPCPS